MQVELGWYFEKNSKMLQGSDSDVCSRLILDGGRHVVSVCRCVATVTRCNKSEACRNCVQHRVDFLSGRRSSSVLKRGEGDTTVLHKEVPEVHFRAVDHPNFGSYLQGGGSQRIKRGRNANEVLMLWDLLIFHGGHSRGIRLGQP